MIHSGYASMLTYGSGLSRSALDFFAPIAPPAPLRHASLALPTVLRSHSAKLSALSASVNAKPVSERISSAIIAHTSGTSIPLAKYA